MGADTESLLKACEAAPKFGRNAKSLILESLLQGDADGAGGCEDAQTDREVQQAKLLTLVKQGSEYIKAVDIKLRPLVAYVPNAKIARVARQTTLNKLAGEHLVLCGLYKQLDKEAVARNAAVRSEAFGHALAQELALFKSSQTTGGYQSKSPKISAIDWEPARPADTVLVVQPRQEEEEEERRKAAERAVAREKRKRDEVEARRAKKPVVLEEADLDWAGAGEEDDA